jgi:hypothetical protein
MSGSSRKTAQQDVSLVAKHTRCAVVRADEEVIRNHNHQRIASICMSAINVQISMGDNNQQ